MLTLILVKFLQTVVKKVLLVQSAVERAETFVVDTTKATIEMAEKNRLE